MALFLVVAAFCLVVAWLALSPAWHRSRLRRIAARPFPRAWERILESHVPAARRLPRDLSIRLRERMNVFLATKRFTGCAGQEIDDTVRVTIAAQAVMPALSRSLDAFPRLSQVLVYPGPFVVERIRAEPSGILQETRQALSGESWTNGQVVLSWDDVLAGAADPHDGRNVVIHEFAHQLDQEKGFANGAPAQALRSRAWAGVMGQAFAELQAAAMSGLPTLLDPYAATDPAEFFAVASEVFFERPMELRAAHPALYGELARYYRLDPAQWR